MDGESRQDCTHWLGDGHPQVPRFLYEPGTVLAAVLGPTNTGASCLSPMFVVASAGRRHHVMGKENMGGGQMDPSSNADAPMDEKLTDFS